MSVLPAYVCELLAYQVFTDVQGGHQISGTRTTDGYEPPCGWWGQDRGRLGEQPLSRHSVPQNALQCIK